MSIVANIRKQRDAWRKPKPATKAASDYNPDLRDRQHLSSSYAGVQAEEIADSFVDYASVYRSYVWVRKAIRLTAQNIAPLTVRVVDQDNQPIDNHPVSQLLARGNDAMPASNIWDSYVVAMLLSGESPIEIVNDRAGRPLWLWPRRPDLVYVRPDMNPERANYPTVASYLVMPDASIPGSTVAEVAPDRMIFDKFDNPLNVWRGISPASAVRESITIDIYAQAWAKMFFKRGARPDYAVLAPQGITKTERDEIETELMYKFSGSDNWHKPIVLEQGVTDIKTFSFPPRDMEWMQQREFSRDEVGAMYGVPDELMGWGKDTYENMDFALRYFWTMTLKPLADHRDQILTHFFTTRRPMLLPGQRVATDMSGVGVLQEDKAPKVDMASKLFAMGVPFNQLDTQLQLGIGPVERGDIPGGKEPAPPPVQTPPPAGTTQNAAPVEDAPEEAQAGAKGAATEHSFFTTKAGSITREAWLTAKALVLQTTPDDDDAEEQLRIAVEQRNAEAIRRAFLQQWRELLPENAESMSLFELTEYINAHLLPQRTQDAITHTVMDGVDLGVNIALDQLGQVGMSFDYTLVNTRARDWGQQYSGELIREIDQRTRENVRQAVARWYENGEPLSALRRALEQPFGADRAMVIAQTETTAAAAHGTLAGYRESGVVTGMRWATVNDELVCPICGELNGKIVDLDGRFWDILPDELKQRYKRTFSTPPAHPRCRCRLRPKVMASNAH